MFNACLSRLFVVGTVATLLASVSGIAQARILKPGSPMDSSDQLIIDISEAMTQPILLPMNVVPGNVVLLEPGSSVTNPRLQDLSDIVTFYTQGSNSYAVMMSDKEGLTLSPLSGNVVIFSEVPSAQGGDGLTYVAGNNTYKIQSDSPDESDVPEPLTMTSLATGLVGLLVYGRRRQQTT